MPLALGSLWVCECSTEQCEELPVARAGNSVWGLRTGNVWQSVDAGGWSTDRLCWSQMLVAEPATLSWLLIQRFSVQRFNLSCKIKHSINGNLPARSCPSPLSRREGLRCPAEAVDAGRTRSPAAPAAGAGG